MAKGQPEARPCKIATEDHNCEPRFRRKSANPLQAGIVAFLDLSYHTEKLQDKDIPKRYTRYGSLLLLGPTFHTHSLPWATIFSSLTEAEKTDLFCQVVKAFRDNTLTHVAINAPIAARKTDASCSEDNLIRSPQGLQPVYGDFGPGYDQCDEQLPSQGDLESAYWTHTTQLDNIAQVWAPRWTMFSRGNISEKARILGKDNSKRLFPGLTEFELGEAINKVDVVDFYVGIGYFAFCYLSRGVARVWGWEINGWSVEGFKRGCIENGWDVRVIRLDENGQMLDGQTIAGLVKEISHVRDTRRAVRCVVFWGDNRWASKILHEVKSLTDLDSNDDGLNIRHCNLGLLPSSGDSWVGAVEVIDSTKGGWLHVHENVEVSAITAKRHSILHRLKQIASDCNKAPWTAECCHIEQVKTYAPGIVHCVYDIKLYPSI